MDIWAQEISVEGYERVVEVRHAPSCMHGIIAIHKTTLGPALGGIRAFAYPTFEEALEDVLRLAEGMTYKAAVAQTGTGGGKSVLILRQGQKKTPEMLQAFAHAINLFEGSYIGAEDVNMSVHDVALMRAITQHLVGLPNTSGNPAIFTARGGLKGIQAAAKVLEGSSDLSGKRIAIQGLGATGFELARFLFWEGAHLIVTDLDEQKVELAKQQFGAEAVLPNEIFDCECFAFAPCAMGGILNEKNSARLKCRVVAGIANNQLLTNEDERYLQEKNILYVPDFVINAGGLINVSVELSPQGYCAHRARTRVDALYEVLKELLEKAKNTSLSTQQVALSTAWERIEEKQNSSTNVPVFHQ